MHDWLESFMHSCKYDIPVMLIGMMVKIWLFDLSLQIKRKIIISYDICQSRANP